MLLQNYRRIQTPMEILDMLRYYSNQVTGFCRLLTNHKVKIHHIKDEDKTFYVMDLHKMLTKYEITDNGICPIGEPCSIKDRLVNKREYEVYSNTQVFKCGYIKLSHAESGMPINTICAYRYAFDSAIHSCESIPDIQEKIPIDIPTHILKKIYGNGYFRILQEKIEFRTYHSIDINLYTIPTLAHDNGIRNKYGIRNLPFDRDKDKNSWVYVTFIDTLDGIITRELAIARATEALSILKELFEYVGFNFEYEDMEIKYPLYI